MTTNPLAEIDPMRLNRKLWPGAQFAPYQEEIVYSVEETPITTVVACNKSGKDWIASLIGVNCFLRALKLGLTCRIVSTSVAEHHLKVLWGEVGRWVTTATAPLIMPPGPLVLNYQELRYRREATAKNPLSYFVGRVSAKGEGMAGHHADITLGIIDEASGVDDEVFRQMQGWTNKVLCFGNPNPCAPTHFFRRLVKQGNVVAAA